MRVKRHFARFRRSMPESEIERIGTTLEIALPGTYCRALRDNPLAYSMADDEPAEFCMDADEIIATNLSFRSDGVFGRNWTKDLLWIGSGFGGTDTYFMRVDSDPNVFYLEWERYEHTLENLDELPFWKSLDHFFVEQLREYAEIHVDEGSAIRTVLLGHMLIKSRREKENHA